MMERLPPPASGGRRRRLDVALTEAGLAPTREVARRLILAGQVTVEGRVVRKPGASIPPGSTLRVTGPLPRYVSRGGEKLEAALTAFPVRVEGVVAMDAGASTGGFTDCLLQHGARLVYAIDVGQGQLAPKLRADPRVRVLERTNIRYLTPELLGGELPELATIDVSFISLKLVLPAVGRLLKPGGQVIALVKPQFEAGRGRVGKKGVIRDPRVHREVLYRWGETAREQGFFLLGLIASPLLGSEGNREFLAWLGWSGLPSPASGEPASRTGEPALPAMGAGAGGLSLDEWRQRCDAVIGGGPEQGERTGPEHET